MTRGSGRGGGGAVGLHGCSRVGAAVQPCAHLWMRVATASAPCMHLNYIASCLGGMGHVACLRSGLACCALELTFAM